MAGRCWPISRGGNAVGAWSKFPNCAFSDKRLSAADFSVLGNFALHSNAEGWSWPSVTLQHMETGRARRQIMRSRKRLEQFGYLRRRARGQGYEYQIEYEQQRMLPLAGDNPVTSTGDKTRHQLVTALSPRTRHKELDKNPTYKRARKKQQRELLLPLDGRTSEHGPHPSRSAKLNGGDHGRRLAADWRPTPDLVSYAQGHGLDPDAEAEAFVDFWTAESGQRASKRDWQAAFRTWCRRSVEQRRRPSAAVRPAQRSGGLDAFARGLARVADAERRRR